jgi:hypothetical protein
VTLIDLDKLLYEATVRVESRLVTGQDKPISRIFVSRKDWVDLQSDVQYHAAIGKPRGVGFDQLCNPPDLAANHADFCYRGIYGNWVLAEIEPQFVTNKECFK